MPDTDPDAPTVDLPAIRGPLTDLLQLPGSWFQRPLARAFHASSHVIRKPFSVTQVAGGIYAWQQNRDLPEGCSWVVPCPADPSGDHAANAMLPQMVAGHIGAFARGPVIDGLSPAVIRHIKAHSVARFIASNWDIHQTGRRLSGDTRSFGGVVIKVRQGNDPRHTLRFIVAFSGAEPWKDEQFSYLVGHAVVADLIEEGLITQSALPQSDTFVLDADPAEVARLTAEQQ